MIEVDLKGRDKDGRLIIRQFAIEERNYIGDELCEVLNEFIPIVKRTDIVAVEDVELFGEEF